jgi:hypothetical protein
MLPIIEEYISFADLKRCAAEKRSQETTDWVKVSITASRGYLERKSPNFPLKLCRIRKELALRYYQLMTGHVVIAPYLKHKIKMSDSDSCWWCEKDVHHTREHLFKECPHWKEDIQMFWRKVAEEVGPRWKRYQ